MNKPEKQVMTFESFNKMLMKLYGNVDYHEQDFINPTMWFAIYIAGEADADNTVNGIMAYYDTVEMSMMFNTDFLDAMCALRMKLQLVDEFTITDAYRLN